MRVILPHSWNVSSQKAIEIQESLQKHIRLKKFSKKVRLIAGCDASFKNGWAFGVVVVMLYPQLDVIETIERKRKINFPYIPGLLTFREGPVLLDCFKRLKHSPDIIIFDGQGIAHFRKMGLAAHLGLILSKPTIGCAKSRLTGQAKEPSKRRGAYTFIMNNAGETIGAVLRTRDNVNPVYVSPGHLITLTDSIKIILKCTKGFRIPEPLRHAHRLTRAINLPLAKYNRH